ncbi:hypothetical protein LL912_02590 [Niabella sp. CC-SYL272]|uniref:hypothetical protein n=1 Tax=Niabella agricola TaxID=2891571 RepID=UPI001F3F5A1D|nr:hypothetical protein [Niabella agricola]MCF3107659.1 hypothetical protein [Niabella agricola]
MNHYPSLDSAYLKLNTDLELTEWMAGQQSVIRIVGACGRSWGAQLVIKSFISVLLKDKGVPLFAAHR